MLESILISISLASSIILAPFNIEDKTIKNDFITISEVEPYVEKALTNLKIGEKVIITTKKENIVFHKTTNDWVAIGKKEKGRL